MTSIGIIPARYNSSRFPGKPLADINGKSMIQRVYEQASKAKLLEEVVVATDDERIEREVLSFGGNAIITSSEHPSGTDRVYECFTKFSLKADVVVNVQGDEPYISPSQIDELVYAFQDEKVEIATLAKKIEDPSVLFDPNKVKVVRNKNGFAIYFSRQAIPFNKQDSNHWLESHTYFKHIGLYAYRSSILKEIVSLEQSNLEIVESLEQLRWLDNGYSIKVLETSEEAFAIDTPEDLEKLLAIKK